MRYFLGLDNGGTSTKAALYDANGRVLAVESRDTAVLTPAPDCFERDMEEMWAANCAVIRGVAEKSGVSPGDIAGAAVCGPADISPSAGGRASRLIISSAAKSAAAVRPRRGRKPLPFNFFIAHPSRAHCALLA